MDVVAYTGGTLTRFQLCSNSLTPQLNATTESHCPRSRLQLHHPQRLLNKFGVLPLTGGVVKRSRRQAGDCEALWGRDRAPRPDPRLRTPPPPDPRQASPPPQTDSQYPPPLQNPSSRNPDDWRQPPNFPPPPPNEPFSEDAIPGGRDWRARRGPQREVNREELLEQSRRIRARIRQLKRQRQDAYYGEVGEGLSFIKGGLNPEMINGRCAMVGFFAAMVTELTTGQSVWEQLTYRGGLQVMLIPLTVVVIMLSSYAPGANEMEDDGLTRPSKPFGPFNSYAERINGRFAMIGFVALILIEAVTGEALFKIG